MSDLNLLGRTIGRFEILAELGRGGMAVVYRARQTDLERIVALKVLPPELSYDQSYIARFHQEARSAAGLEHPHIVPIFEIGAAEGLQYIAMKYIAGGTLKEVVDKQGRMSLDQVVVVLEQIAGALDYAHSKGVIHRDIKPSNIMIAENGWVYLTDFGLARSLSGGGMTMAGTVMGTPEYMSPEQAQGLATIGTPTDIYALGVVVYELLTGKMPFQADTPMGMLIARLQQAPRPPRDYRGDLPEAVEDVIMRALARKPEARFPTAGALVQALKQAANIQTSSRMPVSPPLSPPRGTPVPVTDATTVLPPTSQPTVVSAASQPTAMMSPNTPPATPMQANPRMATPPNLQAASLPTTPSEARKSGGGKGLLIGLAALLLVLVVGAGGFFFVQQRTNSQVEAALNDAFAAFREKEGFDRALQHYDAALAIDPELLEAQIGRAQIFILRGHYEQAERAARAAIAIDEDDARAHALLAEALSAKGEYQAALKAAEQAIDVDDEHASGYSARAAVRADLAALESDASLMQKAVEDAEQALKLANTQDILTKAMAHRARGYVYWQEYALDQNVAKLDSGIESFKRAIDLQEQIAEFYTSLGYFYDAQGNTDEAVAQYETALAVDPNYGHVHAGLGWNLYYLGDYQGALNEFDQALSFAPEDLDALIGKSMVYLYRNEPDHDAAIAVMEQALKIAPNSPSVLTELGWAYYNKALAFDFGSEPQRVAYAEAEHFFREALNRSDKNYNALNGLGWVLHGQGEMLPDPSLFDEAIDVLNRSIKLRGNQQYTYVTLGWSYFGKANYNEAVKAFTEAAKIDKTYSDAYYGLGRTYEELGDLNRARKAYEEADKLGNWMAKERLAELP